LFNALPKDNVLVLQVYSGKMGNGWKNGTFGFCFDLPNFDVVHQEPIPQVEDQ
jgi:hypothetical protein